MKLVKLSCITAALALLSACSSEQTSSAVVRTEGIWASMKVESDGNKSRVVAELNVSSASGNNLVLSSQDTLTATAGGVSKTLLKDTDILDIDYQEYLDVTADDTEFTIALLRQNDSDAPDSKVTLPPNFSIHGPLSSDVFTRNQTIAVDWDGLGEGKTANLNISSVCKTTTGSDILQATNMSIDDDGQYDINLGELDMFKNTEVDYSKDCTLNLTIRRESIGQVDSMFVSGSKIEAAQYRRVESIRIDN